MAGINRTGFSPRAPTSAASSGQTDYTVTTSGPSDITPDHKRSCLDDGANRFIPPWPMDKDHARKDGNSSGSESEYEERREAVKKAKAEKRAADANAAAADADLKLIAAEGELKKAKSSRSSSRHETHSPVESVVPI